MTYHGWYIKCSDARCSHRPLAPTVRVAFGVDEFERFLEAELAAAADGGLEIGQVIGGELSTDRIADDFVAITAGAAGLFLGEPQQLVIKLDGGSRVTHVSKRIPLTVLVELW